MTPTHDAARGAGRKAPNLRGYFPPSTEVVAPDWLRFMRTPAPTNGEYGGHVWPNRPSGEPGRPPMFPGAPPTTISAEGHVQHVTVSPDSGRGGVVVVRLGNLPDAQFRNATRAIGRVIGGLGR